MSLDKSIENGREHRKRYYKRCYQIDYTCRNHGGKTKRRSHGQCPWCLENRMHKYRVSQLRVNQELEDNNG